MKKHKHIEDILPQDHPEMRPDEYFVGNYPQGSDGGEYRDYQLLKRFGEKAYDKDNNVLAGYYPLFVSKEEYDVNNHEDKIGQ